jgi:hypothetical protein
LQSFHSARSGGSCFEDSDNDGENNDALVDTGGFDVGMTDAAVARDLETDYNGDCGGAVRGGDCKTRPCQVTAGRILVEESDDDFEVVAAGSRTVVGLKNDFEQLPPPLYGHHVNETQFQESYSSSFHKSDQKASLPASQAPPLADCMKQQPHTITVTSSSSTSTVGSSKRSELDASQIDFHATFVRQSLVLGRLSLLRNNQAVAAKQV